MGPLEQIFLWGCSPGALGSPKLLHHSSQCFFLADLPVLVLIMLILHPGARLLHAVCLGLDKPSQKLALGSI